MSADLLDIRFKNIVYDRLQKCVSVGSTLDYHYNIITYTDFVRLKDFPFNITFTLLAILKCS